MSPTAVTADTPAQTGSCGITRPASASALPVWTSGYAGMTSAPGVVWRAGRVYARLFGHPPIINPIHPFPPLLYPSSDDRAPTPHIMPRRGAELTGGRESPRFGRVERLSGRRRRRASTTRIERRRLPFLIAGTTCDVIRARDAREYPPDLLPVIGGHDVLRPVQHPEGGR